jgi:dipeptidyl aminopeptidase/acylaminoacyl peptidase
VIRSAAALLALIPTLPAVSPDGSQIAWVDSSAWKIYVAAPDGSGAHVLARAPTGEGISDLHWTTRGIVVDSNFTLYLVRPGKTARKLEPAGFAFAVGGTRVASGPERGPGRYVITDVVSGRQWRMGSPKVNNSAGALSPDGLRVAWSAPGGLWTARVGATPHRLAVAAGCPSWSPDGKSLTFLRGPDLRLISASGGRSKLLVANAGGCQRTVWSPDSSTVAYAGPRGLFVVDARSGAIRRQPKALGAAFDVTWSPDGADLYVVNRPPRMDGNCTNLSRLDVHTLRGEVAVRGCP